MKNKGHKPLLSLVLPIFNEAESLPFLFVELKKLQTQLQARYRLELLFVDDGSSDATVAVLQRHKTLLPIKVVTFSRNFGHQAALLAGLKQSKGDVVISLDSDLQHPPSFIPRLLAKYEKGFDIVFTRREDDVSTTWFKRITSDFFYKIINLFSQTKIQESGSDFRLMNRDALNSLFELPEHRVFLRGMVSWIGYQTTTINFRSQPRKKGYSKYNLYKMLKLATFGLASFTTAPLYLSAMMAVVFSIATVVYGVYVLYVRFIANGAVAGWSSVIFILLGMGSILSFLLAILGVYLAAIYDEVKQRPIYIIRPKPKRV